MMKLISVQLILLAMAQPLISEPAPSVSVQQAAAMDHSISTMEDYKQYLQSIQKIYLKQSFFLPISKYAMKGIGVRIGFGDGEVLNVMFALNRMLNLIFVEPQGVMPEMALPAACIPEMTTVPIQMENLTAGSFIFPTCTRYA